MKIEVEMLLYCSTAAGVEIIVEAGSAAPLSAIAKVAAAGAVPPVGIAMFPENETWNLARHWLFANPRKVTSPLPPR